MNGALEPVLGLPLRRSIRSCFVLCSVVLPGLAVAFRKSLERFRKIGFVLQRPQLSIVASFNSTKEIEHRLMSPHSSATLVSVQLAQLWQHPSDGFSRSVRLL